MALARLGPLQAVTTASHRPARAVKIKYLGNRYARIPRVDEQRLVDYAKLYGYIEGVTKVGLGEFRNHASHYVRRAENGETIVILKRRHAVAVLQPCDKAQNRRCLLGAMAGTATIRGDVTTGIPERWFRT